jgi:hypothetical protein
MSIKVSTVKQNLNIVDYNVLAEDLKLASLEGMTDEQFSVAKFNETGERPEKIAVASAEKFGLRHAYWDVWAPVEGNANKVWTLEKDATTGEEFIKRAE